MKHTLMDGDPPFLPQEIITDILKRLPVRSLIRFRCVCKHWKNLFKTPSFIAEHLHYSRHQNPYLLFHRIGRADPGRDPLNLYLLACEMQFHKVQNAPLIDPSFWVRTIISCNGLLCIEIRRHGISPSLLLWNPAIREVRQVPRTTTPDFDGHFFLGFGFSPIVHDYKIVRTYVTQFYCEVTRVEVYSLHSGSWKELEFGNLEGVSLRSGTVTANGLIFWLGSIQAVKGKDGDNDRHLIVSFDIAMEVFSLIPMPALGFMLKCTVYENKLAVLSCTTIGNNFQSSFIDLWVMEEGSNSSRERWSWTKKYTSSFYPCLLLPVTIWRNEIVCNVAVLIHATQRGAVSRELKAVLYLFNPTTNKVKIFPTSRWSASNFILNYVESLVSVDNIQIEEP